MNLIGLFNFYFLINIFSPDHSDEMFCNSEDPHSNYRPLNCTDKVVFYFYFYHNYSFRSLPVRMVPNVSVNFGFVMEMMIGKDFVMI